MGLDEYNTESAARGEPLDIRVVNETASSPTMSEDEAKKAIKKAKGIYKHVHRPEFQKGSTAAKLDEASKYGAATTFTLGTAGAATLNPVVEFAAGLGALGTGGLTIAERVAKSRENVTDKNSRVMEARKCCDAKCEKNVDNQIDNLRRKRDNRGNPNMGGCTDPEGMYLYVNKVTKGNKKDTCTKLCKADAVLTDIGSPDKGTPECGPNPDLTVSKHCGAKGKEGEVGREDTDAGTEVDADAEVDESWKMESIDILVDSIKNLANNEYKDSSSLQSFLKLPDADKKNFVKVLFAAGHKEASHIADQIAMMSERGFYMHQDQANAGASLWHDYDDDDDDDDDMITSPPTSPLPRPTSDPGTGGGSTRYKKRKPKTRRKQKSTKKPKTNRKQKSRRKQKTNRKQKSKRKSKIKKTKRR